MKKVLLFSLIAMVSLSVSTPSASAVTLPDDNNTNLPTRKLHPERNTEPDDPWANADDDAAKDKKDKKDKKKDKKSKKNKNVAQCCEDNDCSCKGCKCCEQRAVTNVHLSPESPAYQHKQESSLDKSLLNQLLSADYSLVEYKAEEPKPFVWIDDPISTQTDTLERMVVRRTFEGKQRVMPSNVTMRQNDNAIYFYFDEADSIVSKLHMRVQYYADDPLEYHKLDFFIDGFHYFFEPSVTQRGREGSKMYWELSDDPLNASHKDLIYALSHGKHCVAKFIGERGMNHVKTLSATELKEFNAILELYRAKGGTIE